jgi:hypothetical protein
MDMNAAMMGRADRRVAMMERADKSVAMVGRVSPNASRAYFWFHTYAMKLVDEVSILGHFLFH